MKRRNHDRTARAAGATFTLPQAAELIGLTPAELAAFIREAGIQPAGPEAEWRLEADDVVALKAEREKRARQNLTALEKLGDTLPDG